MMANVAVVEKGIPIPERKGRPRAAMSLALDALSEIGDSVLFALEGEAKTLRSAVSKTMQNRSAITGYKFAARTLPNGIRVWRIS